MKALCALIADPRAKVRNAAHHAVIMLAGKAADAGDEQTLKTLCAQMRGLFGQVKLPLYKLEDAPLSRAMPAVTGVWR